MLKIVVGGQINKKEIFDYIQNYYGTENVKLEIKNDLDAVMAMQSGQFDYYIGACNTGGGGALWRLRYWALQNVKQFLCQERFCQMKKLRKL